LKNLRKSSILRTAEEGGRKGLVTKNDKVSASCVEEEKRHKI